MKYKFGNKESEATLVIKVIRKRILMPRYLDIFEELKRKFGTNKKISLNEVYLFLRRKNLTSEQISFYLKLLEDKGLIELEPCAFIILREFNLEKENIISEIEKSEGLWKFAK